MNRATGSSNLVKKFLKGISYLFVFFIGANLSYFSSCKNTLLPIHNNSTVSVIIHNHTSIIQKNTPVIHSYTPIIHIYTPKTINQLQELDELNSKFMQTYFPKFGNNLKTIPSNSDPPFFLLSHEEELPIVSGDLSQQLIIDKLDLKTKCKEDPETIVVDVGAFLGEFGLYASACGCQVYQFEPSPIQTRIIRGSIDINGFQTRHHLLNVAVSNSTEKYLTFESNVGVTHQIDPSNEKQEKESNSTFVARPMTLDQVFPSSSQKGELMEEFIKNIDKKIYFMKVDTEGFEPHVLFDCAKTLFAENRVEYLVSEYTAWWSDKGRGPWDSFLPKLAESNDAEKRYFGLGRVIPSIWEFDETQFDSFYQEHLKVTTQTDVLIHFKQSESMNKKLSKESQPFVWGEYRKTFRGYRA